MSSLRVMVKRSRGNQQLEETEKQQHVIMTENNLGFSTGGILNYDQKYLESDVAWSFSSCGRFLPGRSAETPTVAIKLAGLLLFVIVNNFCTKTFK